MARKSGVLKVYVLMISKVFPAYHPRAGKETFFKEKILQNFPGNPALCFVLPGLFLTGTKTEPNIISEPKLHTIRENYDLWAKRAEKINAGEAVLSIRQWSGKPYRSKQVEFLRLEKMSVQKITIRRFEGWGLLEGGVQVATEVDGYIKGIDTVAKNDGLSVDDFCKWFKKDMKGCVIHFTENFRY